MSDTAITLPCYAGRQDDPRFDYGTDTFDPPPGTWAPECGHPACIEDDANCPSVDGWHNYDCPVARCRWDTAHAICDLDDGHAGEHQFTPADEIVLEFAADRARGEVQE